MAAWLNADPVDYRHEMANSRETNLAKISKRRVPFPIPLRE